MSKHEDRNRRRARGDSSDQLRGAIDDLENAVQGVVRGARDELSQRTAETLKETAATLRRSLHGRDDDRNGGRDSSSLRHRSRKLYRDPARGRIAGVCVGFADYFGIETWVTRCIAVSGLLFMGSITLPAYFIAYLLMDRRPQREDPEQLAAARRDHRSPTPEFGPRFSPRRSLRNIEADLREAELRLRRAESHVTSDQYFLRKELHALDR